MAITFVSPLLRIPRKGCKKLFIWGTRRIRKTKSQKLHKQKRNETVDYYLLHQRCIQNSKCFQSTAAKAFGANMRTAMENIMKKLYILEVFREIVEASLLDTTRVVAEYCLWGFVEEAIQRKDSISAPFSVRHDMVANNGLVLHAH